jgi:hypothetical protein
MQQVRAKFRVDAVGDDSVTLSAVVGGSPENDRFFAATPSGQIQMNVTRPETARLFEPGREYYVDFTPADEA